MSTRRRGCVISPAGLLFSPRGLVVEAYAVATGTLVTTLRGHTAAVTGVALHPSRARQVLTTSLDGTLRTWDADDGACLATTDVGVPLVRLVAPPQPPRCSGGARVFVVAALLPGGGSECGAVDAAGTPATAHLAAGASYPLGEEPACLQARPPGMSLAHVLNTAGTPRDSPLSRVIELRVADHSSRAAAAPASPSIRVLLQARGFCTGLDARCFGSSELESEAASGSSSFFPDLALALTIGRSLYVLRSSAAGEGITVHAMKSALSSCTLHPSEPLVTVGELFGKLLTLHLALELGAVHTPVAAASAIAAAASTSAAAAAVTDVLSAPIAPHLLPSSPRVAARSSAVHWHAHTPWATTFVPDGSFLLSGGEECTLVLWQLGSSAGGGGMPRKDERSMTFLPRLGAPIRAISAFSAASMLPLGGGDGGQSGSTLASPSGGGVVDSSVRAAPPLLYAVTLSDNALVVLDGLNLRALWRVGGLAIAGLPAVLPIGVARAAAHTLARARAKELSNALALGDAAAALRASAPPSAHFPEGPLPSTLLSSSRHLRRGVILDPRTRRCVVNALPGRAALQWFEPRSGRCPPGAGGDLEVRAANLRARTDAEPPAPVRVTHAAFSSDGQSLATVEVEPPSFGCSEEEAAGEGTVLRFWEWTRAVGGGGGAWRQVTRVDAPHEGSISVLEFSPSGAAGHALVVTASTDRTFKTWQREGGGGTAATAAAAAAATAAAAAGADGGAPLNRRGRRASRRAAVGDGGDSGVQKNGAAGASGGGVASSGMWSCQSVGFWRDTPVTAGAFSGDASLLGLAFGPHVTLWTPRANVLKRSLAFPTLVSAVSPPAPIVIDSLGFAGLSPFLVASAPSQGVAVWDLCSCTLAWAYAAPLLLGPLAFDRVGLAASSRFALLAGVPIPPSLTAAADADATYTPYAIVFDAAGPPQPVSLLRLAMPTQCSAGPPLPLTVEALGGLTLPSSLRDTSAFACVFIPPPAPGTSAPNDLCVLDPLNSVRCCPLPPHVSRHVAAGGMVAPPPLASVVVLAGGDAGGSANAPVPATSRGTRASISATVVTSGLAGLGLPTAGAGAGAGAGVSATAAGRAFTSLLAGMGPTSGVPSASYALATLLPALLPPSNTLLAASSSCAAPSAGGHSSKRPRGGAQGFEAGGMMVASAPEDEAGGKRSRVPSIGGVSSLKEAVAAAAAAAGSAGVSWEGGAWGGGSGAGAFPQSLAISAAATSAWGEEDDSEALPQPPAVSDAAVGGKGRGGRKGK